MARPFLFATALLVFAATDVNAQDDRPIPPQNAQKLSAIVTAVEARPDFQYISEILWDAEGYRVVYHTADKAKVEITYDPATGQPK